VYVRLHCGQRFILWPRFVIGAAGQRRLGSMNRAASLQEKLKNAQVGSEFDVLRPEGPSISSRDRKVVDP
jgi:hypothetical protein